MSGVMCPCVVKILFDAHPTTIWKGGAKHYALISVHLFLPKHLCLSHTYLHAQKNMHATGIHLHYTYTSNCHIYCTNIAVVLLICCYCVTFRCEANYITMSTFPSHMRVWCSTVQCGTVWYSTVQCGTVCSGAD